MHLSGDKKQEAALNFALPSLSALVSVALINHTFLTLVITDMHVTLINPICSTREV